MADSSVAVAPPQRPPPPNPNRAMSPPGPADKDDGLRVVDSRSSKVKPKTQSQPRQAQPGPPRTTSPEAAFTIIDSKHSPLVDKKSPAPVKSSVPPPRPQPPAARPANPSTAHSDPGHAANGDLIQLSPSLSEDRPAVPKNRPFSPPRQGAVDDPTYSTIEDGHKPKPAHSPTKQNDVKPAHSPTKEEDFSDHLYATVNKANKKQKSSPVTPVTFDDPIYSGGMEPEKLSPTINIAGEGLFDDPKYAVHKEVPTPPKRPSTQPNKPSRPRSMTMDPQSSSGSEGAKRSSLPKNTTFKPASPSEGNPPSTVGPGEGSAGDEGTGPEEAEPDPEKFRPSRPPPPRSRSVPKAKSLTTYKDQRDMRERSPTMDVGSLQRNRGAQSQTTPPRAPPPTPTKPSVSPPAVVATDILVDLSDNTTTGKESQTSLSQSPVQSPSAPKSPISSQELTLTPDDQSPTKPSNLDSESKTTEATDTPPIPTRPYLPKRPFPPRPNSGGRQGSTRPQKTRDHSIHSPHHPSKRSPKKPRGVTHAQTHHTLFVTQSRDEEVDVTQSLPLGKAAIMTASEVGMGEIEPVNESPLDVDTPTLSITNHEGVKFSFPEEIPATVDSGSPDYQSSLPATLRLSPEPTGNGQQKQQEDKEADDKVSELQQPRSPKFGGGKLLNSMKKSFRSLRRPRKQDKGGDLSIQRTHSDQSVGGSSGRQYPDPLPQGVISPLVVQCVAYLNKESVLVEPGLFRIPGDVASIRKLRTSFITGQDVDLNEVLDPHTVCGLLKLHFREMRVSLIPRGPTLSELISHVKQNNVESVHGIMNGINITHMATLRLVIEVFTKVVGHCEQNRMTAGTLATSCGPSIFPYLPPSNSNQLLKFLIDHCTEIFSS